MGKHTEIPGLVIRHRSNADADADLDALLAQAFAAAVEAGRGTCPGVNGVPTSGFVQDLGAEGFCLLAEYSMTLVGVAAVSLRAPHTTGPAWLARQDVACVRLIAVLPETHGVGIGRALFAACESGARDAGAADLALELSADDRLLLGMAARRGYRPVDKAERDGRRTVVLSRPLAAAAARAA